MECPNCKAPLSVAAAIPKEQTVIFTIRYDGDWLAASTVAGVIENSDKLMRALAEDCGFKASCFLSSFQMRPHEVEIGMTVMRLVGETSNA